MALSASWRSLSAGTRQAKVRATGELARTRLEEGAVPRSRGRGGLAGTGRLRRANAGSPRRSELPAPRRSLRAAKEHKPRLPGRWAPGSQTAVTVTRGTSARREAPARAPPEARVLRRPRGAWRAALPPGTPVVTKVREAVLPAHLQAGPQPRGAGSSHSWGAGPETDPVLPDPRLSRCRLPDSACRDLSQALRQAPALTELSLLHNGLSEGGLRVLSEGLAWPGCRVRTFRLQQPGLQEALQHLVALLRLSLALTTLDLSGCQLSEPTVTCLCAVLKHPGCRLQTLSLTSVELSDRSLKELRAVRTARPDLAITHPALDSHL